MSLQITIQCKSQVATDISSITVMLQLNCSAVLCSSTGDHCDRPANTPLPSCNVDTTQMWCCVILVSVLQLDRILYQSGFKPNCFQIHKHHQWWNVHITS